MQFGESIENNVLCQDDKFIILIAKSDRVSASKNSEHIKHQFFFTSNKADQRELEIKHLGTNTKSMWADVKINIVRGELFRTFRHQVMRVQIEHGDHIERRNIHPMLLSKVETKRLTTLGQELREQLSLGACQAGSKIFI